MSKNTSNSEQIPLFQSVDLKNLQPLEAISDEQVEKFVFDTVDFNELNRPKTCLEVDFPIVQVNEIAAVENNATKPIYMMSKWWARRRSSVFRQLLLSAATRAPSDESKAAQVSWGQMYRKSHQKHGKFSKLKVADIFMGGGTTIVEANRLGFDVTGIDLNPVAWWIVKNETTPVKPESFKAFSTYLEAKIRPQLLPYFGVNSPWFKNDEWKFGSKVINNPFFIDFDKRSDLSWSGAEMIYMFWMKHGMCTDPDCNHLTPLVSNSVAASKTASVKFIPDCVCPSCGEVFDVEFGNFRLAPSSRFISSENKYVSVLNEKEATNCCYCNVELPSTWIQDQLDKKGKNKSKKVEHHIVLNPLWLKGITAKFKDQYGGITDSSIEQDSEWYFDRKNNLELIEVRGEVPDSMQVNNIGAKKGSFVCGKCGRQDEIATSSKLTKRVASFFPYMIVGYDSRAHKQKLGNGGRFFDIPNFDSIIKFNTEFQNRKDCLKYVPEDELWFGHQTHQRDNLPGHGYTSWKQMFNKSQLYVHSLIIKEIVEADNSNYNNEIKSHAIGAFQNYLRQNCMFTIWNAGKNHIVPHLSNNNYHPKITTVENSVFSDVGTGNFTSCLNSIHEGISYMFSSYDLKINKSHQGGKSVKVSSDDKIASKNVRLICGSSSDLKKVVDTSSIDLVITDPPFGDNVQYAELSDFFLVWIRKPLESLFPEVFSSSQAPKTLEAVTNKARNPGVSDSGIKKADLMYDRLLTNCWSEVYRILKPSGILAFTFHHDKDVAWINVLESLFKAGFIIEGAFPIRSDSTQGDGEFGAKKIEYDIVHVCKKRILDSQDIYWAKLRKNILESVQSKAFLLAQHRTYGLHLADIEVIIRGEVLEQYSKYYGKVKKNLAGDILSVREILLEANAIAQTLLKTTELERTPDALDAETKVLFSLFREGPAIEFDAAKKRLKGSGVTLEELIDYGWVEVSKSSNRKLATIVNATERWNSLSRKKSLHSDLDQAHFAINCCIGNRQLDGKPADLESWIESHYKNLLPSLVPLLKYMEGNHFGVEYKQAIGMAYRTIERTLNRIKETDGEYKKASDQLSLFE